ncbi:MAG: hypothetical protein N2712_01090 [Brevinematales bacterium]|nr:hypothetical protein [Brevinematales bacterium]
MENTIKKFVDLVRMYNNNPSQRVFRVDRDCYVVFTGFSALDEKPFIRIGYSTYIEKIKNHISNVIIASGYLSSLKEEIKQIESDEFETNFIVPSSINNVIIKFISPNLHHKVNVNVIDKYQEALESSKVLKEITQKYKTYVLLYDNGNFTITFSGKKIFDMFSSITNDLTTSKILNLLSSKLYHLLPQNAIIRVGGNYIIRSRSGEILIATEEFDEKEFLRSPIPLTTVKSIIGNDVISLIDTIRLIYNRNNLRVYTNRDTYEDFKKFTLGIKFVEISDRINLINNVNITSKDNKYSIPLVDNDGKEKNIVFGKSNDKNSIRLNNLDYVLLKDFSIKTTPYISTNILLKSPDEKDYENVFNSLKIQIKQIFNKNVTLSDILKEFEKDNNRIINDRKRLEELVSLYELVSSLPYSEKLKLIVKSEKLEGTKGEEEIQKLAKQISETSQKQEHQNIQIEIHSVKNGKETKKQFKEHLFRKLGFRYLIIGVVTFLLLVSGILLLNEVGIFERPLTEEESRITDIISKLEDTYEPELTKIQESLGIIITDYDIWVYVNKVAVINGYKPLTYRNPKKWEDPDWVYPGNKLKMVDGTEVMVRRNDNMWNISKRKIIEGYIKKNYNVTVKSRAGTNYYRVKKK